jgi:hypothetical protein
MCGIRNTYETTVARHEGKSHFGDLGVDGKKIKTEFEMGYEGAEWIQVA